MLAILQARMSSSRLPGKVMADIHGETMISRQIDRVSQAHSIHRIIVATSNETTDDVLADHLENLGVELYRGSLVDVYSRFFNILETVNAENFVRLTADCPLADPGIIDRVVNEHLLGDCDYTSNTLTRTYPQGLDVEVAKKTSFQLLRDMSLSSYEREHVTPALYSDLRGFTTRNVRQKRDQSNFRWTVDTQEDLDFVRMVYERFEDQRVFNMNDILQQIPFAEQHFN